LRQLLFDYDWLRNKLQVCEVNALLVDYDFFLQEQELRQLQSALRLSANQLTKDRNQLAPHLLGRLMLEQTSGILALLQGTVQSQYGPWLRPLNASLISPGGPLLRTLEGHSDWVRSVVLTPDGKLAVSASWDNTLKVWDLASSQELRTLEGHNNAVTSVALTIDGRLAVSASLERI
jgi:WD40 repeat protein